jgi:hypothetical protein
MRYAPFLRAAALVTVAALGCTTVGENRITGISATGQVFGIVFGDVNGSRTIDVGDDSLPRIKVRLAVRGALDTGLVQVTQANGAYRFRDVPVGQYVLVVDTTSFADTLQVVRVDSASFTVAPADSTRINALVGLPLLTVRQARALPAGRRAFVAGVALNGASTFADSTVHFVDTSGTITLVRARGTFAAGDSMRVRATSGRLQGQPALLDPTVVALGQGIVPMAASLTTQAAAGAVGGAFDAQLVQVRGAIITDTARTAQSFVLTMNDSSGPLQVQLDRTADATFQAANLPGVYVPGNKFDALGVLSSTGSGTWRLRPRSAADLTAIPLPAISAAAARATPPGRLVAVVGVALNGSTTFGDSTVFLADTSGAICLTQLRTAVAAGDSVRVLARTSSRNGQRTLDGGTTTALGRGFFPTATALTTLAAAGAAGGTRDAQLVRVHGAIISDTSRTATSFVLTVSDSSGPLQVQLDRTADSAFQTARLPGAYVPGSKFDVLGVLAPVGNGTWRLRPRSAADLGELPLPVSSIRVARTLPAGRSVVVVGVALNASTTFADTTVHLADTSGVIRLTRLRGTVVAGDSVRIRATVGTRNGQPTLDAGTVTALGQGLYPTAPVLTTLAAAGAVGGTRDAQMVVVPGMVVSDTARTSQSFVLTASDGSGLLEVQLDRTADSAFQAANLPGAYVPGNKFDVVGLLAPMGAGKWRLRPRSAADLSAVPLPVITVAAARALPILQTVVVVGVALNGSATFGDTTVHLSDASGAAIRLTRLRGTVSAGDSVRVRATTQRRAGLPVLDAGTVTALGQGLLTSIPLSTLQAAAAAGPGEPGGTRDGQMVVVSNAVVMPGDTTRVWNAIQNPRGDFRMGVTDGSGRLEVQLDQAAGFVLPGTYVPGSAFDIVGLLVPSGTGTWILKPRSAADLRKH